MRFLIKAIFWFSLVVLLLPESVRHGSKPETSAAAVAAPTISEKEALARISAICGEQPVLCRQTAEALSNLDIQSDEGARLALNIILQAAASDPKQ